MAFAPPFPRVFPATFDRRAAAAGNGLLNNLVAYWALDEAAGANDALDKHTNALTLTQAASPGSAAGKVYAGARTFNGSTQYFSRTSEALLQVSDLDFTFAAWIYHTVNDYDTILSKGGEVAREYNFAWDGVVGTPQVTFWVSSSGANEIKASYANAAVTTNAWHLVIGWHDAVANVVGIAFDTATPVTTSHTLGVFTGTDPFYLSFWALSIAGGRHWQGRLGPIAMWKSAAGAGGVLSAAQRTALWNAGNGLAYSAFTT